MREISGVYVIAEAGVNHNGSVDLAMKLIDAAADAGANAVKFQTFKSELLASKSAPKASYQNQTASVSESQLEMLKKLELSQQDHRVLFERAKSKNIDFLSTPFDSASLHFLIDAFDLPIIKVSSGDLTNEEHND